MSMSPWFVMARLRACSPVHFVDGQPFFFVHGRLTMSLKKRGRPRGSRNKQPETIPVERMGYRIAEYAKAHGVSRSAVYNAINRGELKTMNIGRWRIILR
jgi:Helix-turn-helix domain